MLTAFIQAGLVCMKNMLGKIVGDTCCMYLDSRGKKEDKEERI